MNKNLRKIIRETYRECLPEIEKNYPNFDPYIFDWTSVFTPIENNVWADIRYLGCPIKCPQFPVSGYFIDFADPVRKIGIEVDGKEWHSSQEQIEKDQKREAILKKFGWTIYRIEGAKTYYNQRMVEQKRRAEDDYFNELEDEEENKIIPKSESESEEIIRKIMQLEYPSQFVCQDEQ